MTTTDDFPAARGEVPCTYHPNVMTGLRCSRCGKPICPRCGVRTPVGLRCPDCAGVRGLPTYQTGTNVLLRTGAVGLAVAVVIGVIWGFAPDWGFYLSLALGFATVEAMAWACNAKRGRDLQLLAWVLVTIGIVVSRAILAERLGITWSDVNNLEGRVITEGVIREYGFPVSTAEALHLQFIPDIVYAALAYLIGWVRFR